MEELSRRQLYPSERDSKDGARKGKGEGKFKFFNFVICADDASRSSRVYFFFVWWDASRAAEGVVLAARRKMPATREHESCYEWVNGKYECV